MKGHLVQAFHLLRPCRVLKALQERIEPWWIAGLGLLTTSMALAAPGDVDPSFIPALGGFNTGAGAPAIYGTALQADGTLMIGGAFSDVNGSGSAMCARLNADGSVFSGFVSGLPGNSAAPVYSISVQADGKVIVSAPLATPYIKRLNVDGSVDGGFTAAPDQAVLGTTVLPDGKIILAGSFASIGTVSRFGLARLNADGSVDGTFDPGLNGSVECFALQPDGKILIAGNFTQVGSAGSNGMARLNADGSLDTAFSAGALAGGSALCLAVQSNGQVLVGGQFTSVGGMPRTGIARLDTSGSLDGFNPDLPSGFVSTVIVQADGKILIAGQFNRVNAITRNGVARLNADGSLDAEFSTAGNFVITDLSLQADGGVIVGPAADGPALYDVVRLRNDPATQSISLPVPGTVRWLRGGSAPETQQVTFEISTDAGASWSLLGAGSRIAGGWQLGGLSLPGSGKIRARARIAGGYYCGSSGIVDQVQSFTGSTLTSSNADLANLVLSSGTMKPAFSPLITSYTVSVSNATASLTVVPAMADANATVTVNGIAFISGNLGVPVSLREGSNIISIVAAAEDGTIKTCTLTVWRAVSHVTAVYNTGHEVPFTSDGYVATGTTVSLMLNHAPAAGAQLMILHNTGLPFIQGTFSNLVQGQVVPLGFGGTTYYFTANYHGGSGNDLVLQWAGAKVAGWGEYLGQKPVALAMPRSLIAGKTVVEVAAGASENLALCSDGTLIAWAENVPAFRVDQTGALQGRTVIAIATGLNHSLALCSDGTVAAWGANSSGQLGDNSTTDAGEPVAVNTTPGVSALAGKTVVALAAGEYHSLALCDDGAVAGWGGNSWGELGSGSAATMSLVPVAVNTSGALARKTVVGLYAGNSYSLARCSDGTTAAWGYNSLGQLGDNSTSESTTPVAVHMAGSALAGKLVTGLAAGDSHALALASDGTIAAWGYNGFGQLGNKSTTDSQVPVAVATAALFGKTVIGLSAGQNHSLALCSDGTIAAWGSNSSGQLGNNGGADQHVPVTASMSSLLRGERVIAAAGSAGSDHNLAIIASPAAPQIAVEQPPTNGLDSGGDVDFGDVFMTSSASLTFTVRNTGTAKLTGLSLTSVGPNRTDFATSVSGMLTNLAPGGSTTFKVAFKPAAQGLRNAMLQVASNDATQSPFGIALTGTGALSSNAELSALALGSGSLSPGFGPLTVSYAASVPNYQSSITVTPTVAQAGSTVKVNSQTVASGKASNPVNLAIGANTIIVTITAQDGTIKTYSVEVSRAGTGNALLAGLSFTGGALDGAFSPQSFACRAYALGATVSVTPVLSDPFASMTVNGVPVVSGSASPPINVGAVASSFAIVVTARDGSTRNTYNIAVIPYTVTASLASLSLNTGALSPGFSPGTLLYSAAVTHLTTSVTVSAASADARTTITVNGASPAWPVTLNPGLNTLRVAVTAMGSGVTQIYVIQVTRAPPNADLAGLAISAGPGVAPLSPAFTSPVRNYTCQVPPGTSSITATPTVTDGTSSVHVNNLAATSGNATAPIPLRLGANTVNVVVTAQDGITQSSYSVIIIVPPGLTAVFDSATDVPVISNGYTALGVAVLSLNFAPPPGTQLTVVHNTGSVPINGTFSNIMQGQDVALGYQGTVYKFTATYSGGAGNDFVLQLQGPLVPPVIVSQPSSALVGLGQPFSLGVAASGYLLSYQWSKNNLPVAKAGAASYSVTSAALAGAGSYTCKLTNAAGNTTSTTAVVGVVNLSPATVSLVEGSNLSLTLSAAGPGMTYEWRKHGVKIANGVNPLSSKSTITGVSAAKLVITATTLGDSDAYTCNVSMPDPQQSHAVLQTTSGTFAVTITAKSSQLVCSPQVWIVGGDVADVVISRNGATSFAAAGLPDGVSITPDGHFSGRPNVTIKTPTVYPLTVTASGAAGACDPLNVEVLVMPVPANAVGTFNGLVDQDADFTSNQGGMLTLTSTATGAFSGRLALAGESFGFTGRLNISTTANPTATVAIPGGAPLDARALFLAIDRTTGELTGTVANGSSATPANVRAVRNPWDADSNRAPVAAMYTAALVADDAFRGTTNNSANLAYPQGTGHGTLTIAAGGDATWAGRLADNTAVTFSTTVGNDGDLPVHMMLYNYTGSLHGWTQATADDPVTPQNAGLLLLDGKVNWKKNTQAESSGDRSYPAGFIIPALTVTGGEYVAPAAGQAVLDLVDAGTGTTNASLTFNEGGLTGPPPIAGAVMASDISKSLRITSANAPVLPTANPASLTLILNAATGAFSGTFVLKNDPDPTSAQLILLSRTVNYYGLMVPRLSLHQGVGLFTLPELPSVVPPTTLATTPILSGNVTLEGLTP